MQLTNSCYSGSGRLTLPGAARNNELDMKEFILLGNKLAATTEAIWPHVITGEVHYGYTSPKEFLLPNGEKTKKLQGQTRWYTNLPVKKECTLKLTKSYYADPTKYPKYEGFDAIEVSRVKDIPYDYEGVMGVPIGFLDHLHPDFRILGTTNGARGQLTDIFLAHQQDLQFNGNGRDSYTRIFIKRK